MTPPTVERMRLQELRDRLLDLMRDLRTVYEPTAGRLHCLWLRDELVATRTSSDSGTLLALTRALDECLELRV